jgi:citrate lyase beta subunit
MSRARSLLSVPASNPRMIEKGLASGADLVFLDLEDSVATEQKAAARSNVIQAINHADWRGRPKSYRANQRDSPWFTDDIVAVHEATSGGADRIILPKIQSRQELETVVRLLDELDGGWRANHRVSLEVQIESALALVNCEAIAALDSRVIALTFGPGDYAASVGLPSAGIGLLDEYDEVYPGHRWHYPMSRIAVAAGAAGIVAIDGPYADFRDAAGLRKSCMLARALGFSGKWCIHPAQIDTVNGVFSPTEQEIERARLILESYQTAKLSGIGATSYGSLMIDGASVRMAERTLKAADLIDEELTAPTPNPER